MDFKKQLQKNTGASIASSQAKIQMLPISLNEDYHEALLYLFFCLRYLEEHLYKVILSRCDYFKNSNFDAETKRILKDPRSFSRLQMETSYEMFKFC